MKKRQEEILRDIRKSGKEENWVTPKLKNCKLADIFNALGMEEKGKNIACCAYFLKFVEAQDDDWKGLKLVGAKFCQHKLCPVCNKRRARKHSYQVRRILEVAQEKKPKARYIFLTLTDKNVYDGESLNKAMLALTKAFARLMDRAKVKRNFIGAIRTTEVTVNKKDGSYNQHMHVLLMVESTYYTGNSRNYINHAEWTEMWQRSLKVDYTPVVHVQAVKPHKTKAKDEKDLTAAAIEVAKYPVKDVDYLVDDFEECKRRVEDLDFGLYRKRQIDYSGLLKDIKKMLGMTDVESEKADLIDIDDKKDNTDSLAEYITFSWDRHRENYFRELG